MANCLSANKIEIRHIAVSFDFQGLSVGRPFMDMLIEPVRQGFPLKIGAYARNISIGFYAKLGFITTEQWLEHD